MHDNTLDQYVARLRRKLRETRGAGDDRDRRTGSATGCDEALPHAARPAHRARPARARSSRSPCSRWPSTSSSTAASTRDANGRAARSLAAAAAATVEYANGRLRVHESADDAIVDRQVWVYDGTRAIERPPATPELQRTADALAGSRPRVRRRARQRRAPVRRAGARPRGRQVGHRGRRAVAGGLRPHDRPGAARHRCVLAVVLLAAVGVLTWITVGRALDPVREMTALGGRLERARSRPSASAPRRVPTSSASWRAPSTRCWTAWPRACATSSACRPSSRTSCARRWRGSWPRSSCCSGASARPRIAATPTPSCRRSAEQMSGILETLMAAARAEAQLDVRAQRGRPRPRPRRRGLGARAGRARRSSSRCAIRRRR